MTDARNERTRKGYEVHDESAPAVPSVEGAFRPKILMLSREECQALWDKLGNTWFSYDDPGLRVRKVLARISAFLEQL